MYHCREGYLYLKFLSSNFRVKQQPQVKTSSIITDLHVSSSSSSSSSSTQTLSTVKPNPGTTLYTCNGNKNQRYPKLTSNNQNSPSLLITYQIQLVRNIFLVKERKTSNRKKSNEPFNA